MFAHAQSENNAQETRLYCRKALQKRNIVTTLLSPGQCSKLLPAVFINKFAPSRFATDILPSLSGIANKILIMSGWTGFVTRLNLKTFLYPNVNHIFLSHFPSSLCFGKSCCSLSVWFLKNNKIMQNVLTLHLNSRGTPYANANVACKWVKCT